VSGKIELQDKIEIEESKATDKSVGSTRACSTQAPFDRLGRGTLLVIGTTVGHCYHRGSLHKA